MTKDIAPSSLELRETSERALQLQAYLLRRAWGALYAAWATAVFVDIFVTSVVAAALPSEFTYALHVIVSMIANGTAVAVSLRAFRRVHDTAEIRDAISNRKWTRPLGYRAMVLLWVAVYLAIIPTLIFFSSFAVSVVLLIYATFAVYLYYSLRLSFEDKIPLESVFALSSLAAATIGSFILEFLFFMDIDAPYALLWGSTIIAWIIASVYARTRKPPSVAGV